MLKANPNQEKSPENAAKENTVQEDFSNTPVEKFKNNEEGTVAVPKKPVVQENEQSKETHGLGDCPISEDQPVLPEGDKECGVENKCHTSGPTDSSDQTVSSNNDGEIRNCSQMDELPNKTTQETQEAKPTETPGPFDENSKSGGTEQCSTCEAHVASQNIETPNDDMSAIVKGELISEGDITNNKPDPLENPSDAPDCEANSVVSQQCEIIPDSKNNVVENENDIGAMQKFESVSAEENVTCDVPKVNEPGAQSDSHTEIDPHCANPTPDITTTGIEHPVNENFQHSENLQQQQYNLTNVSEVHVADSTGQLYQSELEADLPMVTDAVVTPEEAVVGLNDASLFMTEDGTQSVLHTSNIQEAVPGPSMVDLPVVDHSGVTLSIPDDESVLTNDTHMGDATLMAPDIETEGNPGTRVLLLQRQTDDGNLIQEYVEVPNVTDGEGNLIVYDEMGNQYIIPPSQADADPSMTEEVVSNETEIVTTGEDHMMSDGLVLEDVELPVAQESPEDSSDHVVVERLQYQDVSFLPSHARNDVQMSVEIGEEDESDGELAQDYISSDVNHVVVHHSEMLEHDLGHSDLSGPVPFDDNNPLADLSAAPEGSTNYKKRKRQTSTADGKPASARKRKKKVKAPEMNDVSGTSLKLPMQNSIIEPYTTSTAPLPYSYNGGSTSGYRSSVMPVSPIRIPVPEMSEDSKESTLPKPPTTSGSTLLSSPTAQPPQTPSSQKSHSPIQNKHPMIASLLFKGSSSVSPAVSPRSSSSSPMGAASIVSNSLTSSLSVLQESATSATSNSLEELAKSAGVIEQVCKMLPVRPSRWQPQYTTAQQELSFVKTVTSTITNAQESSLLKAVQNIQGLPGAPNVPSHPHTVPASPVISNTAPILKIPVPELRTRGPVLSLPVQSPDLHHRQVQDKTHPQDKMHPRLADIQTTQYDQGTRHMEKSQFMHKPHSTQGQPLRTAPSRQLPSSGKPNSDKPPIIISPMEERLPPPYPGHSKPSSQAQTSQPVSQQAAMTSPSGGPLPLTKQLMQMDPPVPQSNMLAPVVSQAPIQAPVSGAPVSLTEVNSTSNPVQTYQSVPKSGPEVVPVKLPVQTVLPPGKVPPLIFPPGVLPPPHMMRGVPPGHAVPIELIRGQRPAFISPTGHILIPTDQLHLIQQGRLLPRPVVSGPPLIRAQAPPQAPHQRAPQIQPQGLSQVLNQIPTQVPVQAPPQAMIQVPFTHVAPKIAPQTLTKGASQAITQVASQVLTQESPQALTQVVSQALTQVASQALTQVASQALTQVAPQSLTQVQPQVMTQILQQTLSKQPIQVPVSQPVKPSEPVGLVPAPITPTMPSPRTPDVAEDSRSMEAELVQAAHLAEAAAGQLQPPNVSNHLENPVPNLPALTASVRQPPQVPLKQRQPKQVKQPRQVPEMLPPSIGPSCAPMQKRTEDGVTLADKYMKDWQPTGRYKCKFCHYSSVTQNFLFRHWVMTHSGVKPYLCAFCNLKSPTKDGITRHQTAKHKEFPREVLIDVEQEKLLVRKFRKVFTSLVPYRYHDYKEEDYASDSEPSNCNDHREENSPLEVPDVITVNNLGKSLENSKGVTETYIYNTKTSEEDSHQEHFDERMPDHVRRSSYDGNQLTRGSMHDGQQPNETRSYPVLKKKIRESFEEEQDAPEDMRIKPGMQEVHWHNEEPTSRLSELAGIALSSQAPPPHSLEPSDASKRTISESHHRRDSISSMTSAPAPRHVAIHPALQRPPMMLPPLDTVMRPQMIPHALPGMAPSSRAPFMTRDVAMALPPQFFPHENHPASVYDKEMLQSAMAKHKDAQTIVQLLVSQKHDLPPDLQLPSSKKMESSLPNFVLQPSPAHQAMKSVPYSTVAHASSSMPSAPAQTLTVSDGKPIDISHASLPTMAGMLKSPVISALSKYQDAGVYHDLPQLVSHNTHSTSGSLPPINELRSSANHSPIVSSPLMALSSAPPASYSSTISSSSATAVLLAAAAAAKGYANAPEQVQTVETTSDIISSSMSSSPRVTSTSEDAVDSNANKASSEDLQLKAVPSKIDMLNATHSSPTPDQSQNANSVASSVNSTLPEVNS